MGIWISFTKNPMNPIIAKPIAVAMAIFWNSAVDNTNQKTNTSTAKGRLYGYVNVVMCWPRSNNNLDALYHVWLILYTNNNCAPATHVNSARPSLHQ